MTKHTNKSKPFTVITQDSSSQCVFLTEAKDAKKALANLLKNSWDFKNVIGSDNNLTIRVSCACTGPWDCQCTYYNGDHESPSSGINQVIKILEQNPHEYIPREETIRLIKTLTPIKNGN